MIERCASCCVREGLDRGPRNSKLTKQKRTKTNCSGVVRESTRCVVTGEGQASYSDGESAGTVSEGQMNEHSAPSPKNLVRRTRSYSDPISSITLNCRLFLS